MLFRRRSAVLTLALSLTAAAACGDGPGGGAEDPGAAPEAGSAAAPSPDTYPVDGTVTVDTQALPESDSVAGR